MTTEKTNHDILRVVSCNACGSTEYKEISVAGQWHVVQCAKCSLIFVNPMPFFDVSNIHESSETFYYTTLQYTVTPEKVAIEKDQLQRQLEGIEPLKQFSKTQQISCLDVGCGSGLAVRAALDLGWKATGIDIDPVLIELGKKELGVDIRCTTLEGAKFADEQYSYVRFKFVMEHLPNPYEMLREVHRILKPGGVVLIVVPNEAGFINQLNLRFGFKQNDRYGTLIVPHHLHAYDPSSMSTLLKRSGFEKNTVLTTVPTNPMYATTDQMAFNMKRKLLTLGWNLTAMVGLGSVLVAYGVK